MTPGKQADIVRITLAVLFIALLITISSWILLPFLTALIWAATIVVTTWSVMLSIQKRLFGKRWLAVTVMTLFLLLVLIVPLTLCIISIIDRSGSIVEWGKSLSSMKLPPAPEWLKGLPVVGNKAAAAWQQLANLGQSDLASRISPYAKSVGVWLVARAGSLGMMLVQFLLTVVISAVLYTTGEKAAHGILLFAKKLSGRYGEDAAILAAKAIKGVALGVVVTALIQSILAGIGLLVSGVPAAIILTGVSFLLCVAQIGPALVLIPATIWLFYNDQQVWGIAMIFWTILCSTIDNFIRPVLIRKGADLPLLLIFAGVIGGLLAFGVVGLFIGPVMLAVTYTLLQSWVQMVEPEPELSQSEPERKPGELP